MRKVSTILILLLMLSTTGCSKQQFDYDKEKESMIINSEEAQQNVFHYDYRAIEPYRVKQSNDFVQLADNTLSKEYCYEDDNFIITGFQKGLSKLTFIILGNTNCIYKGFKVYVSFYDKNKNYLNTSKSDLFTLDGTSANEIHVSYPQDAYYMQVAGFDFEQAKQEVINTTVKTKKLSSNTYEITADCKDNMILFYNRLSVCVGSTKGFKGTKQIVLEGDINNCRVVKEVHN